MIGTALIFQAAELIGWGGLWLKLKSDAQRQILIHGKPQPQRIPLLDGKLRDLAGHPSKVEQAVASRLVSGTRRVVNTRAFEYVINGLCNRRSKLHRFAKKPPKVVIL